MEERKKKPYNWRKHIKPKAKVPITFVPIADKVIIDTWLETAPLFETFGQILGSVADKLQCSHGHIVHVIKKSQLREVTKEQRHAITEAVYGDKIDLAKRIVGLTLEDVAIFLDGYAPITIQDAKDLVTIATNVNVLLRLELGKSTDNVEVLHRVERPLSAILEDLSRNDPFVTYPIALPETTGVILEEVKEPVLVNGTDNQG